MKAGRLSRAARFHIDILINQDWNQFILMNAGIQALTLTLSLTLPPLMRSMPLPPMLTFWSVSEYLVAGLRVSLCDNLALVTLLTAYGAAPESRVGSTSLEVLGCVVVYFLLVLVETGYAS